MAQLSNLSPGIRSILRRAQAADIGGYGSVAARFDPRQYGSIASRKYPGLFQQQSGDDEMAAERQKEIQTNNQIITLRRQQQYFANPQLYDQNAALRQQALMARYNKALGASSASYPDLFGANDGYDAEDDSDFDDR